MSLTSVPFASVGAFTEGAPSFTDEVFTLNRLFCRY